MNLGQVHTVYQMLPLAIVEKGVEVCFYALGSAAPPSFPFQMISQCQVILTGIFALPLPRAMTHFIIVVILLFIIPFQIKNGSQYC
jgi:hypothetical protein